MLDELHAILAWLDHVEPVEVVKDEAYEIDNCVVYVGHKNKPTGKVIVTFHGTEQRPGLLGVPVEVTREARLAAREAIRVVDVSDCLDEQDVRARVASILVVAADLRQRGWPAVAATLREIAVAVHAERHHQLLALAVLES